MGSNAALIGFEFEQKLRLSETEIFGPKPLSFRCTSIKKVTIFRGQGWIIPMRGDDQRMIAISGVILFKY